MTHTGTIPVSTTSSSTPQGEATARRRLALALAVVAPLGALGIALGKLAAPYGPQDSAADAVAAIAAHSGRVDLAGWFWILPVTCLVPGVLAAGLAAVRGAPRLATWGLLVAVPTWSLAFVFPNVDALVQSALAVGIDSADVTRLFETVGTGESGPLAVAVLGFVLGHIVGTVLLGLALWRSRAVPAAIAWGLVVSQPLHFVAFVVLGSVWLDTVAYGLTALGFAAGGWAYYRRTVAETTEPASH